MTMAIRILQRCPYPDQEGTFPPDRREGDMRVVIATVSLVEDLITFVSPHLREMERIIKRRCNKTCTI